MGTLGAWVSGVACVVAVSGGEDCAELLLAASYADTVYEYVVLCDKPVSE